MSVTACLWVVLRVCDCCCCIITMLRLSLLFVAAHIFVVQTGEIHKLALALDALERIANYYRTHPASLNEDGLYGLRIAQGIE